MNTYLYNKEFQIPLEIRKVLINCFNECRGADKNSEGYKRNIGLQKSKTITYQQLKRIKNWFDSFSGKKEDTEYVLNGGDIMRAWVNNILYYARNESKRKEERNYNNEMNDNYSDQSTIASKEFTPLTESIKK